MCTVGTDRATKREIGLVTLSLISQEKLKKVPALSFNNRNVNLLARKNFLINNVRC